MISVKVKVMTTKETDVTDMIQPPRPQSMTKHTGKLDTCVKNRPRADIARLHFLIRNFEGNF
jgi:hypothetical protein